MVYAGMMPHRKTQKPQQPKKFSSIQIKLASPDMILSWSHGEVTGPETINYRTLKPEVGGIFCERIFGPVEDYKCSCGKYQRIRYKGMVCDRCGVEVTESKVRRERMGHIKLVVPVVHVWYFRSVPSKIALLLGLTTKKLDQIIYYERYVVIQPGEAEGTVQKLDFLTEDEYYDILESLPKDNQQLPDSDPRKFIAKMGGEAVMDLLSRIDLDELSYELRHQAHNERSQQRRHDALRRLQVVERFRKANRTTENRPEWMVLRVLPVIPPELRPLIQLDGGRFASSDLNELYRRVIIRNNRLKRLLEMRAPEVVLRNEKRMLQEAVDALLDNSRKTTAVKTEANRPLKSLSDILKGKQGRFRQNLLGKRVDYSGRSVIVVGPTLKLHECGLPKVMAAELFKPFIIRRLLERGIAQTTKTAKKLVERKDPVIWDILESVLKGHPVLLNRAPTLHRLSIQAMQPKLVEGKAIQLHPLVCTGFNADFDGDQMAVHVPLSNEAILEAQLLMLSSHNILTPANGTPITVPSQDMVLGLYYLTKIRKSTPEAPVIGEGRIFGSPEEALEAYAHGKVDLHAEIKVRLRPSEAGQKGEIVDTSVGRLMFNRTLPKGVPFINKVLTKKALRSIIGQVYEVAGTEETTRFLDEIKHLGFYYAFKGGLSFGIDDIPVPPEKQKLIDEALKKVDEIWANYQMGIISSTERYNQVIDLWSGVTNQIVDHLIRHLREDQQGFNPIYMMLDSGARGSAEQIRQLGGLRGLIQRPQKHLGGSGGIVEHPVLSNLKEGLSVLEYFISTHGARKGLADTALKTADAGYLTRRLHDVAQDVVIREKDCGTLRGLTVSALKDNENVIIPLYDRIVGRVALNDVVHPITGEVLVEGGEEITEEKARKIVASPIESVEIRSVLTCETQHGVCEKCYGRNLAYNKPAQQGDSVGVIAAQSIGEPGTQLTLRTFHLGGTATAKGATESEIKSKFDGVVEWVGVETVVRQGAADKEEVVISRQGEVRIKDPKEDIVITVYHIPYASVILVKDGQKIKKDTVIARWDPYNSVFVAERNGRVQYRDIEEGITYREEIDEQTGHKEKVIIESRIKTKIPTLLLVDKKTGEVIKEYYLPVGAHIIVNDGKEVHAGDILIKIPRMLHRASDITGGLPRVTELFEARNPSDPAVISEIDGVVIMGKIRRGQREVFIQSKEGERKKYLIPISKHILVQENDRVKAGDPLTDGAISPADILRIKGPQAVQQYIVNGIQQIYRHQGVVIADKHIEVIVRQMMQKVKIDNPGDTRFLPGSLEDKYEVIKENNWIFGKKVVVDAGDSNRFKEGQIISLRELREENSYLRRKALRVVKVRDAQPATVSPVLQGITRASLSSASWLAAASFQEAPKVLNNAVIEAKIDPLRGLKENVLIGGTIPAGTGQRWMQKLKVFEIAENGEGEAEAGVEEEAPTSPQ